MGLSGEAVAPWGNSHSLSANHTKIVIHTNKYNIVRSSCPQMQKGDDFITREFMADLPLCEVKAPMKDGGTSCIRERRKRQCQREREWEAERTSEGEREREWD